MDPSIQQLVNQITWLGHASFKIQTHTAKSIYIDPWKLPDNPAIISPADIILVSHEHYDHMSIPDIEKIYHPETMLLTPSSCKHHLERFNPTILDPGTTRTFGDITFRGIWAYNTHKSYHPRVRRWIGVKITFNDQSIYYAGDTDATNEMNNIFPDIALIPVGGTYTMNAEEGAKALDQLSPQLAIPYHFGDIVGTLEDAKKFKELAPCAVHILAAAQAPSQ